MKVRYPHELSEKRIKDIFTARCYHTRYGEERKSLYSLLKPFLRELRVIFSDREPTLALVLAAGRRLLIVNPFFVKKECENDNDIADCVMHEVVHHILDHLKVMASGVASKDILNLALDSLVNALLEYFKSAKFCSKYYPDEVPYSFLRPGSRKFLPPPSKQLFQRLRKQRLPDDLLYEYQDFYGRLYSRQVATDEAIEFFKKHFLDEQPKNDRPFIGGHGGNDNSTSGATGENGSGKDGGDNDSAGSMSGANQSFGGKGRSEGSVFDPDEIRHILEELGLQSASRKARNNFADIVKRVTTNTRKPGKHRQGTVYSKRMPARLNRKDLISIEREHYLFERGDYKAKGVVLFFDYSGSMGAYAKFCIDLARSLERDGNNVRVIVWADGIKETPYKEFLQGKVPNVGGGTKGEEVAKFLRDEKINGVLLFPIMTPDRLRPKFWRASFWYWLRTALPKAVLLTDAWFLIAKSFA